LFDDEPGTSKDTKVNVPSLSCFSRMLSFNKVHYRFRCQIQEALRQPALSRVCQRIRGEVLPIFYGRIMVECGRDDWWSWSVVTEWATAIGRVHTQCSGGILIRDRGSLGEISGKELWEIVASESAKESQVAMSGTKV
jgi:hypothetical protein